MKATNLKIVLTLVALVMAAGVVSALDFNVTIDPSYRFLNPAFDDYFYLTDQTVIMQLQMANNDGFDWCAYSMPLRFYGTNDLNQITWVDAGGDPIPSIRRLNGFQVDGNYWTVFNDIFAWSWDGIFPDTMNHSVMGCMGTSSNGWPATDNQLLTRLTFYFRVTLPDGDTGSVCIDSVYDHSDSRYDWLFFTPQDFGGPYCFPFANTACGDVNLDGVINILDITAFINYKYKNGTEPARLDLCDVDGNGELNVLDVVYLINYKYKGGPTPICP